jgi:hypothetical protein
LKYAIEGKEDLLGWLATMIVYAPDNFPSDFRGMDMATAWSMIEEGLHRLEDKDGRPQVMDALKRVRKEIAVSRELFEKGEIKPACQKLQDVEDILKPLKVKREVQ